MAVKRGPALYDLRVFINCPFDLKFKPIFDAIVFTIHDLGFQARHALIDDDKAIRVERIALELEKCKYSLHDVSRVELGTNKLPRFNMPFEAGIAYSLHRLKPKGREHHFGVLDAEPYRYQASLSDIAGLDPKIHKNQPSEAIKCVRDFLQRKSGQTGMPGAAHIAKRYDAFTKLLTSSAKKQNISTRELKDLSYVNDLQNMMADWIKENPT